MKKQLNDGFKMWGNYLQAIDEFTKGDDKEFGRFMRIICNSGNVTDACVGCSQLLRALIDQGDKL